MATVRSFFNSFLSLFLLLFHLGCFLFPTKTPPTKKRKLSKTSPSPPPPPSPSSSPLHHHAKTHKALSFLNPWPYLKPIFSTKNLNKLKKLDDPLPPLSTVQSAQPSTPPPTTSLSTPTRKRSSGSFSESDFSSDMHPKRSSFVFRSDIFPCPTCGEIFQRTQNLEHHQSAKHAVTELLDGDTAKNIVQIIFQTGWKNSKENRLAKIHQILKIHNSPKILTRFEEYRESIKIKSSRNVGSGGICNERCIADGNELLRFQCSTFLCSLGKKGNSAICSGEFCSVCGIIRSGFSPKLDGILTMASSRGAHQAIPEEMEEEFAFMNVKRAMLVCRVVAGMVAREGALDAVVGADKEDGGFDSVVARHRGSDDEEELLVFNPRAVLPCFVIIYTV
ncbi:uncharacterized protein LOC131243973 [Magnolia sinica]|uniref:uncharacterized protein LOC131243973 n=1 Tax=Magnolia sinica TaxID=86752 RepID=UPI00265AAEF7|nr:uncharacterized protein LOC131243973 [Magnolia sinica]